MHGQRRAHASHLQQSVDAGFAVVSRLRERCRHRLTARAGSRAMHRWHVDLLVTGAELVATVDDERRELAGGWVAITDGLVQRASAAGATPPPEAATVLRADGCLVTPGLINTHHHIYQNLTRSLPARGQRHAVRVADHAVPALGAASTRRRPTCRRGSGWPSWRSAAAPRRPTTSTSTRAAAATSSPPRSARRSELGMRFHPTRGSMSRSQKDGGLPPDSVVQDDDEILADSERLVGAAPRPVVGRDGARRAGAVLAVLGDARADARDRRAGRAARRPPAHPPRRGPRRGHATAEEVYGCRTIEHFEDVGWGSDRSWVAHCIYPNDGRDRPARRSGVRASPTARART